MEVKLNSALGLPYLLQNKYIKKLDTVTAVCTVSSWDHDKLPLEGDIKKTVSINYTFNFFFFDLAVWRKWRSLSCWVWHSFHQGEYEEYGYVISQADGTEKWTVNINHSCSMYIQSMQRLNVQYTQSNLPWRQGGNSFCTGQATPSYSHDAVTLDIGL